MKTVRSSVLLCAMLLLASPVRLSGQCVSGTGSEAYKATREQIAGHVAGHLKSDADAAVVMYTKDLRALIGDGTERVGRDAQRDAYARGYKELGTFKSLVYHVDEFIACGDLAYEWGWDESVRHTAKGDVTGGNRFIGIWRKGPEGWRMSRFAAVLGAHAPAPAAK
jgi:ketosteroid isomerase-like protein